MHINELLQNPEFYNAFIERIAEEVIRRLVPKKHALVFFTGAAVGYTEAAEAVRKLAENGWDLTVFATQAALEIYGADKLKNDCGVSAICSKDLPPEKLRQAERVIIAELSVNSAAKIACGIADNEALTLIRNAIMSGKKIVAAVDGACPDNETRAALGYGKAPKAYRDMLHSHLVALASYGFKLCSARDLYAACTASGTPEAVLENRAPEVRELPGPAAQATPAEDGAFIDKHVVSRKDILEHRRAARVIIPADALLTHSAADEAAGLGITISRKEGPCT